MADDQPTCGKGLAANAILPERLGALMNAMATMLENHTRALDLNETNGRLEHDAYERLVSDQRTLASGLEALARALEGNRDLPMARHNLAPLNDQASRAVLAAFHRRRARSDHAFAEASREPCGVLVARALLRMLQGKGPGWGPCVLIDGDLCCPLRPGRRTATDRT